MSMYKIHMGSNGVVKGFGPNVDEYQPYLEDGDTLAYSDAIPSPTNTQLLINLRTTRDTLIVATNWLVERHRDEQDAGTATTLTTEQFAELLKYRQALRDIPAQPGAPWDGGCELTPWPELPKI